MVFLHHDDDVFYLVYVTLGKGGLHCHKRRSQGQGQQGPPNPEQTHN
jgi:hypothetical protein